VTASGESPRSFQRWITPISPAGGHRLVSTRPASITCFSSRFWSSASRIVKFEVSPTCSACRRSIRAASAWKVPSHNPSAGWPRIAATLSRISRAALLVNVTASTCDGYAFPCSRICAKRVVRTRVLPVPAPASTSSGPSTASTAARCSGFRRAR